jgi:Putative beta-barrel porin-2, OmpL-like. bbp2
VVTYKASDKLSFTTELNYIRDDAFQADGYGAAQYASYTLNDQLMLNGRIEVRRDNKGFFVAGFPGNHSFVYSELGLPTTTIAAAPTTYSEFTVGVTYKPGLPGPIQTLMLRPELRYDRSLNGTTPFNDRRDSGAVTLAADGIIGF